MSTVVETLTDNRGFAVEGLLDCGAMGCYIDDGFVTAKSLPTEWLPRPVPVYNVDGTHKEGGPITCTATLQLRIKDHTEFFRFAVTNTGKTDIIVGFNWLQKTQPKYQLEDRRYYIRPLPVRVWNAFSWCGRGRVRGGWRGGGWIRFNTGILRVGIYHTVTIPLDTIPMMGRCSNLTKNARVSSIPVGFWKNCVFVFIFIY